MVHRIQNRNPGYSDFGSTGSAQSFNFTPTMNSPISHGANALKLENEVVVEAETNTTSSQIASELVNGTQELNADNSQPKDYEQSFVQEALNDSSATEETNSMEVGHASNGLENFGVEGETAPDLFNTESAESKDLLSEDIKEDSSESDDLEIPAFLRRQKH